MYSLPPDFWHQSERGWERVRAVGWEMLRLLAVSVFYAAGKAVLALIAACIWIGSKLDV